MSEFLAEARILVRPDTSRFRRDLEAQLQSVLARPVRVPVVPVVGPGFAAGAAGSAAFASAQTELTASTEVSSAALEAATTIQRQYSGAVLLSTTSTEALTAAQLEEAAAAKTAAASQLDHERSLAGVRKGVIAQLASLAGLRAGTLAASSAFIAGTVGVIAFAKAVQSAAQLQTELNVFRVTAGATADEMVRVSDAAKQLGKDITLPGVTANDAAQALTALSKAGLSVQDSLDAARGTLELATAAQIDNADATKLVAGALNSFALSGTQAVHVADLFAGAAKESQGDISSFGAALGQASAVSHAFGVSIEDTLTLLTQLSKAGLEGGRAGTSLRVAFLRLINPTAQAAKILKDFNIQVRDVNGNLRPEVFTDIDKALSQLSKGEKQAKEAIVFGSDAIRTQVLLAQQGPAAFNAIRDAITEAGLAQEQAGARTQGLQGDFENLSNQVSALGLTIGQVSTGPVSALVKSVADIVTQMNLAADGAVQLGAKVGDLGKSVAGVIPGIDKLGLSFGDIVKAGSLLNPLTQQLKLASELAKKFGDDAQAGGKGAKIFGDIADSVTASVKKLTDALGAAAKPLAVQVPQNVGLGVKQIQNVIGGFDAEQVRAKIHGDNVALLDVLNTEQEFLQAQLQRQFVKNRPALKRAIESALLGVVNDIDSVQKQAQTKADKLKADAKKAAGDAAQAVRNREQALLASFGVARDQRQNKIAAAALTAGLQDDIKQQNLLKALVLKQIAAVRDRISIEGGRAAAITALRAILNQINSQQQQFVKEQNDAKKQQREDLLSGIGLDISLDQIQENQIKEVADRKKLVVQLNKDLKEEARLHGTTTLRYKEIRNQIAEQNKAIDAITAEKKKGNTAFAQATFEFLQAQQGFASNLLGNLIPGGATGGLVGGGAAPVTAALTPVAGAAQAQSQSAFTAGQGNSITNVLLQMLQQLKLLNGTQATPEAVRQIRMQHAALDGVGGG